MSTYSFRIRYKPGKGKPMREISDSIAVPDRGEANMLMNRCIIDLKREYDGRWTGFRITKAETYEVTP